eukprot:523017-Rhodomonas_salina.1
MRQGGERNGQRMQGEKNDREEERREEERSRDQKDEVKQEKAGGHEQEGEKEKEGESSPKRSMQSTIMLHRSVSSRRRERGGGTDELLSLRLPGFEDCELLLQLVQALTPCLRHAKLRLGEQHRAARSRWRKGHEEGGGEEREHRRHRQGGEPEGYPGPHHRRRHCQRLAGGAIGANAKGHAIPMLLVPLLKVWYWSAVP